MKLSRNQTTGLLMLAFFILILAAVRYWIN